MSEYGAEYSKLQAAELRAERARQKVSVATLVERTGLSKSAVLNYLNGHRDITVSNLFRMCQALEVPVPTIAERTMAAQEAQQRTRAESTGQDGGLPRPVDSEA